MGQYYKIINVDKQQQLDPDDYGNGLKLMEWAYNRNPVVLALMNLLGGPWKGDRVYVIGDYADTSEKEEIWCATLERLLTEFGVEDLYTEAYKRYLRVLPDDYETMDSWYEKDYSGADDFRATPNDQGYRYIYNHATRQFIDLENCPIEWTWFDEEDKKAYATRIAPLPLLLAMGNGRGGGDYQNNKNEYLDGSWCETSSSIEVAKEPLETASDYQKFTPDFTERDPVVPYHELFRELETEEKKHMK